MIDKPSERKAEPNIPLQWTEERGFEVPLRVRPTWDKHPLSRPLPLTRSDTTPPFFPGS